jgi:hypothetical protein
MGKYTCTASEEKVEVPAGKYKATKVVINLDSNGQMVTTTYWFVQNIGFVRQTVEAPGLSVEMALEKFQPGKKKDAPKKDGASVKDSR